MAQTHSSKMEPLELTTRAYTQNVYLLNVLSAHVIHSIQSTRFTICSSAMFVFPIYVSTIQTNGTLEVTHRTIAR